jgi:hypothetical protein
MSNITNIPIPTDNKETRNFFDNYFSSEISFPSNQIDAVLGFFMRRGFDEQAARTTGIVLLNQAKLDNVNVFELLDKLKSLNDLQMSQVVTQILNYYRVQTSVLGYKSNKKDLSFESRNILV